MYNFYLHAFYFVVVQKYVRKNYLGMLCLLYLITLNVYHMHHSENRVMYGTKPSLLPKPDIHPSSIYDCREHVVSKGILIFALPNFILSFFLFVCFTSVKRG